MEDNLKNKIDLSAEFLGITALAVYSAPWFLQLILLIIIGVLFYYKIFAHSRDLVNDIEMVYSRMQNVNKEQLLNSYRKKFLGFNIHSDKLPTYWAAFALFVITFIYAILNTLYHLGASIF